MRTTLVRVSMTVAFTAAVAGLASAQTTVELPDTSQTTLLTATVSDQAQVTVPAGVAFDVTDVAIDTDSLAQTVTVENIVLASATKQLKVSLQADAPDFTPSVVGGITWSAGDVSWNAATYTEGGTGASGTLDDTAYTEVVTCGADAATCTTADLVFTLAAKATVNYSGDHTLNMTWKFESIN